MKFKIFVACIIGLLSVTSKTYGSTPESDAGFDAVIVKFINSIMTSDYKKLYNILDENLRFKIPHGDSLMIYGRSTVVEELKLSNGRKPNFDPSYVVLTESNAFALVRIDFSYKNYELSNENTVIHNFIVIEKNPEKEWKITQIYQLFEAVNNTPLNDSMVASK